MKFINKIEMVKEFQGIKPFAIDLRDGLNIIVGENGAGKTTIFRLLTIPDYIGESFKITFTDPINKPEYRYLDTEKDNPSGQTDLNGMDNDVAMHSMLSRFESHGQTIFPLIQGVQNFKSMVVFVDEPEAGVSLSNQKKLLTSFHKSVDNGCQLLIATHSYPIIKGVDEVYSLDDRQWVKSEEYLNKVL